ncbi:hypothetical protein KHQ08_07335 [Pseudochrobactrum algeriensis]|uniref:hypothetical protein n=1 Tax=Pseudochrobactrum algeriensis TaxID=2834768 RepID=UPI001BCD5C83|nr:hypothetical protein [Pseudochrobactrum algeriensis]MBX8813370.1 hypothetical protein [Ochrobactrum sp. MR34]QVQ37820.1 hypothetical protein KHQ08_07335 [Pseudochrobactrum algeriensis]QVQ41041.1 hypothetical protein KHQ07_05635 [Pseudochrobactrum algeriensis]QVQ44965.1 hypothetical protein KHQ09_07600 [Pseudochrobactrum algeriensis]
MQTQEPFQTSLSGMGHAGSRSGEGTGLQVLCLEVERQLNRHYKRVLAFFDDAFSGRQDYPLNAEQALMLFCISLGLRDTVQLYRMVEPVTSQSVVMLASLFAQGYVTSGADETAAGGADLAVLALTEKGQAVADGLYELYTFVFLETSGREVPDAARLASMHNSLRRLQKFSHMHGRPAEQ